MCLSVAVASPNAVLAKGEHTGFEWNVVHNRMGHRCGYVKVGPEHPWYGKEYDSIDCEVHGGLTFSEKDVPCEQNGPDDGYWIGFDCGHYMDIPDEALMDDDYKRYHIESRAKYPAIYGPEASIKTQEYVEAECRSLCEQAHDARSHVQDSAQAKQTNCR